MRQEGLIILSEERDVQGHELQDGGFVARGQRGAAGQLATNRAEIPGKTVERIDLAHDVALGGHRGAE